MADDVGWVENSDGGFERIAEVKNSKMLIDNDLVLFESRHFLITTSQSSKVLRLEALRTLVANHKEMAETHRVQKYELPERDYGLK